MVNHKPSPLYFVNISTLLSRDVVLGTRTHTRVQLEYKFVVLELVLAVIVLIFIFH